MIPVNQEIFKPNLKPLELEKKKFTFFSPQRMGRPKGTDLIWKALPLCKSDFEIIQVEWYDVSTNEELEIKKELVKTKPPQVKLVPMIKREDMSRYYNHADAVLGNMRIGTYALIELEAIICKKPVIQYTNPEMKILANGKELISPMIPTSNDPKIIAETIDKIVLNEQFREELLNKEYNFAREISDPEKNALWWDDFFNEIHKKYPKIRKNSSGFQIKIRLLLILIGNRLYWGKIKKIFRKNV